MGKGIKPNFPQSIIDFINKGGLDSDENRHEDGSLFSDDISYLSMEHFMNTLCGLAEDIDNAYNFPVSKSTSLFIPRGVKIDTSGILTHDKVCDAIIDHAIELLQQAKLFNKSYGF